MHIQSSLLVHRSSHTKSIEFQRYWDEMPMITDYAEAICWHEAIFTEDFIQKGFSCDTYVDTDNLKEYSNYPLMLYPTELISNRKCPVFKRKTFYNQYEEFLDVSCGQPAYELYKYLAEHTDYNLNFIWDTLLRTANMADIKDRMQLNYILPTEARLPNKQKTPRVAMFMHIHYMDLADYCKRYAESMPKYADIYLTTNSEEKKLFLEKTFKDFDGRKVKVLVSENRGREITAHFIELKSVVNQYDYICFAHDKKTNYLKPYMVGESFSYHCFENVLASPLYVENIITTFQDNPRLGMLVPPPPIHADFTIVLGNEWQNNFENVQLLAKKLNIKVDIHRDKPPISPLGGIYWYRSEALKILFDADFQYDDFPKEPVKDNDGTIMHALERVYQLAAQESGFYTGWVLSDAFTKMQLTNLNKMLRDYNRLMLWKFGPNTRYSYMQRIANFDVPPSAPSGPAKISGKEKMKNVIAKTFGWGFYMFILRVYGFFVRIFKRSST
jgi:rhamnosyltransferase